MDWKGKQGDGMRTRSFRDENYNNRRVFLRSYPLQWGANDEYNEEDMARVADGLNQKRPMKKIIRDDEYNEEDMGRVANGCNQRRPRKKIILSVFHWGGDKVLFSRRFKHKLAIYVIACIPAGFKTPTARLSA